MMYIPLGGKHGAEKYALIDDADFTVISANSWHLTASGYAARTVGKRRPDGSKTCGTVFMHRVLMQTPDDMFTDHINGIRLDNRRANLRVCTWTENTRNHRHRIPGRQSGVRPCTDCPGWTAWISNGYGKELYLGYFRDEGDAIAARKAAEAKSYGGFAPRSDA